MYLPGWGGPTEVARMMTSIGYADGAEVSRQAIYSLWKHRRANGFPDRERVEVPGGWRLLFKIKDVKAWALERMREREES
jgi:hypothetical protein